MNKTILVTRPDHDLITSYFSHWSEIVINVASKKSFKVLDLFSDKANKKNLISYIQRNNPGLIFFNGHGSSSVMTGYDNEPILELNKDELLTKNRIVYARSCDVALLLGESCVKKKAKAFIGYIKKYALVCSHDSLAFPLKDSIARLFLEPSNLIPISLLKGNTVGEAYRKSQESMSRNFIFMLSTRATSGQRDAAPYLWYNRKYQKALGDHSATL
jgi:hypothetical protein